MTDVTTSETVRLRPMRADARRNYDPPCRGRPSRLRRARQRGVDRGDRSYRRCRRGYALSALSPPHRPGRGCLPRRRRRTRGERRAASDRDRSREALARWLEAFVSYAAAKRTFLTELHEAFEKNPDLAVSSREKIGAATGRILAARTGCGRRQARHRSARAHAARRRDVHGKRRNREAEPRSAHVRPRRHPSPLTSANQTMRSSASPTTGSADGRGVSRRHPLIGAAHAG